MCFCVYVHVKMHLIFLCSLLAAIALQSLHVEGMAVVPRHRHQEDISNQALQFLKNNDDICESHRNYRQAGVEEAIQVQKGTSSEATEELKIIIHHHNKPVVEETGEEIAKRSAASSEENEHLSTYLEKKMDSVESNDKYPKTRSYQESVLHQNRGNRYDSPSNGNLEVFLGGTSNDDSSEDSGYAGREWQYQEFGHPEGNGYQDSRSNIYSQNRETPLEQRYRPSDPEYRAEGDGNRYRPRVVHPEFHYDNQEESGYRTPDTERDEYVPKRKSRYRLDGEEVDGGDYGSERRSGYRSRDEEERSDAYVPKKKSRYRTKDSSEEEKGYKARKELGNGRYEKSKKKPSGYKSREESGYKNDGNYENKEEKRVYGSKEDDYSGKGDKSSSEENSGEDVLVKISVNNDQDSPDVGKVKIDVNKDRDLYPDERQLKITVKKDKDLLPAEDRDIKIEVKKDSEQDEEEDHVKISEGKDDCGDERTIVKVQKPKRKCCKRRKSKSTRKRRY